VRTELPADREFGSSMGGEVYARYLPADTRSVVAGDHGRGGARRRDCGHIIASALTGSVSLPILGLREVDVAAFACAMGFASPTTADEHNELRTKPPQARARPFSRA
jgi:hypothetical protein